MSRFNNPKALPGLLSRTSVSATRVVAEPPPSIVNETVRPAARPDGVFAIGREAERNMAQVFCFFVLNVYLLSGCANDLIFRFTRGKTYISATCIVLLPLLFVATGASLRGLQSSTGIWFVAFAAWLALASPFSFWRGGSANLLMNYIPRAFLVCFYLAACAVTIRQVRNVVRVVGIGALVVLLSCFAFGGSPHGRFSISGSLFFDNANELALQLLLGAIILIYPFFETNRFAKLVSAAGIFVSLIYLTKTGSRGVWLAMLATGFVGALLSRRRLATMLVVVPIFVIAFVLAPPEMRHRITLILSNQQEVANDMDGSAIGSRFQREELLRTSVVLAITNPLFGVGPGQFAARVAGEDAKRGKNSDWLGTHNSYTQVASEAGLPAFIFYCATILTCMRMNYRVYRASRGRPGLEAIAGVSFCMFLSTFAYSISIFFFHEAYGLHLPLMAGISISLHLAAKPVFESLRKSSVN